MPNIPLTTDDTAKREQVRQEEIALALNKAAPGGTVWSRSTLAEVLPEPTPMTWSVIQELLSPRGGFGAMYRDVGLYPSPLLEDQGVYDLICGRTYCNLSREPLMYSNGLPLCHSFAALKAVPENALDPRAQFDLRAADWRLWAVLPVHLLRSLRASRQLGRAMATFAGDFQDRILPQFEQRFEQESKRELAGLSGHELLGCVDCRIKLTLHDYARHSLKATVFAASSISELERMLQQVVEPERAQNAVRELTMEASSEWQVNLASAFRELATGQLSKERFVARFGKRGWQEMELAQPRWCERPDELESLLAKQAQSDSELALDGSARGDKIVAELKLKSPAKHDKIEADLRKKVHAWRNLVALRESAKHHFMTGYSLIRECLLELDHRHRLEGGIFYLVREDLPRLVAGEDFSNLIVERQRRRALALSLYLPPVLFSDDLDAIGRRVETPSTGTLRGVPVSAGVAEETALVLQTPDCAVPKRPYILVCPATDPAWLPLFANARGLVMETGGILSHGAILAREFGLPAVTGLPGACQNFQTGQVLRVDGSSGTVVILPARQRW
jgi:pyruvate,water dikinase